MRSTVGKVVGLRMDRAERLAARLAIEVALEDVQGDREDVRDGHEAEPLERLLVAFVDFHRERRDTLLAQRPREVAQRVR